MLKRGQRHTGASSALSGSSPPLRSALSGNLASARSSHEVWCGRRCHVTRCIDTIQGKSVRPSYVFIYLSLVMNKNDVIRLQRERKTTVWCDGTYRGPARVSFYYRNTDVFNACISGSPYHPIRAPGSFRFAVNYMRSDMCVLLWSSSCREDLGPPLR